MKLTEKQDERLKAKVWKACAEWEEKKILADLYGVHAYRDSRSLKRAKTATLKLAADLDKALAIVAPPKV
jgi:hypothetical protein